MADSFDSLMGGSGAGALLGAAQLFSNVRAQNYELQGQAAVRDQNMFGLMQQQMAMDRQTTLQSQALAAQNAQSAREFALQREESAFARLNQGLETQLKISEREAKERDSAFQRSMQAQLFQIQTKQQMLQLERVELENRRIDLQGQVRSKFVSFQASSEKDPEGFINDMVKLKNEYEDVLGLDEATPLLNTMSGMMEAAKQYKPPRLYKISNTLVPGSESFEVGEIREVVSEMDMSRPSTADERQALSYILKSAFKEYDPDQLTESTLRELDQPLNLDLDNEYTKLKPGQKARIALMQYAMEKTNEAGDPGLDAVAAESDSTHLRNIFKQLRSPEGRARFDAEYEQGLYKPVESPDQLLELQRIQESKFRADAEMAAFIGPYWFSGEYRNQREELMDNFVEQEREILSGGNPLAKRVMGGGIDTFDRMNEQVKTSALSRFTASDILEASGFAGAGRTISNVVTLNWGALNLSDAADLGLTALWFVPGANIIRGGVWAARGGAAGVKAVSSALKMQRTAAVSGRIANSSLLAAQRPFAASASVLSGRAGRAVTQAEQAERAQRIASITAKTGAEAAEAQARTAVQGMQQGRAAVQQAQAAAQLAPAYAQQVQQATRQVSAQRAALTRAQAQAAEASQVLRTAKSELDLARSIATSTASSSARRAALRQTARAPSLDVLKSQRATSSQRVAARKQLLAEKEQALRALQNAPKVADDLINAEKARAAAARLEAATALAGRRTARGAAKTAEAGYKTAQSTAEGAIRAQTAMEVKAIGELSTTALSVGVALSRKDSVVFNELDKASREMDKVIFQIESAVNTGIRDQDDAAKIIGTLSTALGNYRDTAKKYYGGELPLDLDMMLDMRKVLPQSTFRKLQRAANSSPGGMTPSLSDLRMMMRGGPPTAQTSAGSGTQMPASGGFNWSSVQGNE